jgi:hypothetical protein
MPPIYTDIWEAIVLIGLTILFIRYRPSEIQAKFDRLISRVGSPRKFLFLSIIVILALALLSAVFNDYIKK